MSYIRESIIQGRKLDPSYHSTACLANSVDAFCDGKPEPGCICDGDAKVAQLNGAIQ